jgi:hypothetical protein
MLQSARTEARKSIIPTDKLFIAFSLRQPLEETLRRCQRLQGANLRTETGTASGSATPQSGKPGPRNEVPAYRSPRPAPASATLAIARPQPAATRAVRPEPGGYPAIAYAREMVSVVLSPFTSVTIERSVT